MKVFKVHNVEKVKQEVNLPAGTYTYSCRVIPVGTSYTFRLDNQSFTFEGLTAGVLNKRMKHTFELTEAVSFFYLSNTIGDCVYEPQIEEGVFATTPGAHTLDFERLISEAGIEIDHEALSLYAKKVDVSAEIKITADRIDSIVGNISNDVDGVKGDMTTISQTVNSITSTVTNHTSQISRFQQTVDQIYIAIEDVGSGEFASIVQRLDEIELKVGAPGKGGLIQLTVDSISSIVYDENTGMSAINQKVGSITATVTNHTTQIATFQQTVDQIYIAIEDVGSGEFASIVQRLDEIELKVGAPGKGGSIQVALDSISSTVYDKNTGMSAINQKVGSITATVTNHTTQIATFQQTVDQIYLAIEDVGSGEFASIITRLDKIELKVGAPGKEGSIQVAVDSVTTRVEDIDFGLTEVVVKVGSVTTTVADHTGKIAAIDVKVDSVTTTVADHTGKIAAIDVKVDSVTTTVADHTGKIAAIDVKVDSVTTTVADHTGKIAAIDVKVDSVTTTVADNTGKIAAIKTTVDNVELSVADIETGIAAIDVKVDSISSTVYDKHGALLSQISQNGEDVLIKGTQIDLRGAITLNNKFKVLTDGSIEAVDALFSGAVKTPFKTLSFYNPNNTYGTNIYLDNENDHTVLSLPTVVDANGMTVRIVNNRTRIKTVRLPLGSPIQIYNNNQTDNQRHDIPAYSYCEFIAFGDSASLRGWVVTTQAKL